MKATKALKRLAEIETLLTKVVERYAANGESTQKVLQEAKNAVLRAKEAVSLQASSRKSSKAATRTEGRHERSQSPEKIIETPISASKPAKPRRRLSAAGKAAIVAALKRRWAIKRAEASKTKPAVRKTVSRHAAVKKVSATKTAAKKTRPKAAAATITTESTPPPAAPKTVTAAVSS